MKFTKLVRIDTEQDRANERLVTLLESPLPHGKPSQLMRDWMTAGFMLDECGHGILNFLLAIDKSPMSPQKRLKGLLQFIEHCVPDEPESPPVVAVLPEKPRPIVTTSSEPVVTASKPRKRQSLLGPN